MSSVQPTISQKGLKVILSEIIHTVLGSFDIPNSARRIAVNFRQTHVGRQLQPIEVQLDREANTDSWQLRFIATFDVICDQTKRKDLSLYFNFARCWFYHPDIHQRPLNCQQVQSLLRSWVIAFHSHLIEERFNNISIKVVDHFD
ncbi:DUF2787 family protein [Vibrio sp. 1F255]|uniref:DUF2787 family protein n=1 Tax=Vibrio sp. 1F255 TaxID=3230009 RepID=UPI00352E8A3E